MTPLQITQKKRYNKTTTNIQILLVNIIPIIASEIKCFRSRIHHRTSYTGELISAKLWPPAVDDNLEDEIRLTDSTKSSRNAAMTRKIPMYAFLFRFFDSFPSFEARVLMKMTRPAQNANRERAQSALFVGSMRGGIHCSSG